MSIAWTTILVIVGLLPGVGFFSGYWSQERYSREIVRSTAIGEIGMAVFVAALIHLAALGLLDAITAFDLSALVRPIYDFPDTPGWVLTDWFLGWLIPGALYVIAVTISGFLLGLGIARMVMFGWLRFLATHRWAYDLIQERRTGIVSTFVMTNVVENNRILMYAGHLEDFFLGPDGCFTYLVLKNCSRYYMAIEAATPLTTARTPLFRLPDNAARRWEHLVISGTNIANVLFDPIGHIQFKEVEAAQSSLDQALKDSAAAMKAVTGR